ncbi:MAG: hypothetical protein ACK2UO_21000 [Caldilineaceae bacterium]|jgi:hypothetical protein
MVVNGERVWVPDQRRDLIAGLKRMGVTKVGGRTLRSAATNDLRRVYCRERARVVRQRQQQEQKRKQMRVYHSQSFAAWSAQD